MVTELVDNVLKNVLDQFEKKDAVENSNESKPDDTNERDVQENNDPNV